MDSSDSELELARARCRALHGRLAASPDLPRQQALGSLLRLVAAELRFLSSVHAAPSPATPPSSNLPHLAALHLLLTHPAVRCPSRLAPLPGVDFACAFRGRPAWALISARNPARLAWGPCDGDRGLRARVEAVLDAAHGAPPSTHPEKLLLVFSRGVGADIVRGLAEVFGAVGTDLLEEFIGDSEEEDDKGWVGISFHPSEGMRSFRAFEIDVVEGDGVVLQPPETIVAEGRGEEEVSLALDGGFGAFLGKMRMESRDLVNLDTTALVAIISGISNGRVGKLMAAPEAETRARFKCNYKFVMDQAQSELQAPILLELGKAVDGKQCIICETVNSEFKEIVLMCGGPEEKTRARLLLKQLTIVPDSPSARMMDLPTTRKLAMKNKIVFGTGDHWRAPTLTANMGFVRAVSQTGMPLLTTEHRPRALIGL